MSKGLDPDQDQHFDRPGLDPNCLLLGYQQTKKVATNKEGVEYTFTVQSLYNTSPNM